MLGRYQVEKELGKGAMGVVYCGKDPKIGRVVAIKTMALSQEFEADELDGGEGALLPRGRDRGAPHSPEHRHHLRRGRGARPVLHRHGVPQGQGPGAVHQAAEPAAARQGAVDRRARGRRARLRAHAWASCIATSSRRTSCTSRKATRAKVTDFGIARITDSSKTKTGMVLGTPSYMSPEQLAGKKIDGRSDLFSLGVTLYQMLCGQAAVRGRVDDAAHVRHRQQAAPADPRDQRRRCRSGSMPIIDKALAKDFEKRYQTGAEFAAAIRAGAQGRSRRARCRDSSPRSRASPCTSARSRSAATSAPTACTTSRATSSTPSPSTSSSPRASGPRASRSTTCGCASPWTATLHIVDAAASTDAMPYVGDCDRIAPDVQEADRPRDPARLPAAREGTAGRRARLHAHHRARGLARHGRVPDARGPGHRRTREQKPFQLDRCHALDADEPGRSAGTTPSGTRAARRSRPPTTATITD